MKSRLSARPSAFKLVRRYNKGWNLGDFIEEYLRAALLGIL